MKDQKIEDLKNEFLEAAENGDERLVKKMLEKGPKHDLLHMDFKERFPYEETPLHYACREGHFEVVKLLLENGASENVEMTSSALFDATKLDKSENLYEIVEALLNHGAIVDFELRMGDRILWFSRVNEDKNS